MSVYEEIAIGFANALARIDQRNIDQAAAWYQAVWTVRFELENQHHHRRFDANKFERVCGVGALAKTRARLLAPLKSNHQCRRCSRWLEGEWNRAKDDPLLRAELQRQMDAGRCDPCAEREALRELDDHILNRPL